MEFKLEERERIEGSSQSLSHLKSDSGATDLLYNPNFMDNSASNAHTKPYTILVNLRIQNRVNISPVNVIKHLTTDVWLRKQKKVLRAIHVTSSYEREYIGIYWPKLWLTSDFKSDF